MNQLEIVALEDMLYEQAARRPEPIMLDPERVNINPGSGIAEVKGLGAAPTYAMDTFHAERQSREWKFRVCTSIRARGSP